MSSQSIFSGWFFCIRIPATKVIEFMMNDWLFVFPSGNHYWIYFCGGTHNDFFVLIWYQIMCQVKVDRFSITSFFQALQTHCTEWSVIAAFSLYSSQSLQPPENNLTLFITVIQSVFFHFKTVKHILIEFLFSMDLLSVDACCWKHVLYVVREGFAGRFILCV